MEQILYLLTFITAMVVSMSVIPIMARLAPKLGMIDKPDPRKIHTVPVPRAGGVGIVIGSLLPLLLWLEMEGWQSSFVFGALVLLVFGVWDDMHELGHYAKFSGQIIAAVAIVYFGDVYIMQLPFLTLDESQIAIGKLFTVFAIVGMINALNTSDGLDGLAGGMSLLSLSCIAFLGFMSEGQSVVMIAIAALGGVFGFLRYNTFPAKVFMGDGGSQFLGFTLGVLTVVLTQKTNTVLSPALVLLLLGLPVVDLVAVMVQRVRRGNKWYLAGKDHIHHRLLQMKFHHYEAVIIIYSIQTFLVVGAIFLSYESDILILFIYFGTCSLLFIFLAFAEKNKWRAHRQYEKSRFADFVQKIKRHKLLVNGTNGALRAIIIILFLGTSLLAGQVPRDFGFGAGVLGLLLMLMLIFGTKESIVLRAISYVTAAFVVYLESKYIVGQSAVLNAVSLGFYGLLVVSIWLVVRYVADNEFRISPMDFLVILVVLTVGIISRGHLRQELLGMMAVKLVILFYSCELIFAKFKSKWNSLSVTTLVTLTILGTRGLI